MPAYLCRSAKRQPRGPIAMLCRLAECTRRRDCRCLKALTAATCHSEEDRTMARTLPVVLRAAG